MAEETATYTRYAAIAQANDLTEAIRLRLLLDRTRVPYRVRNEQILQVYPLFPFNSAFGPMVFEVPEDRYQEALMALEEIFEIDASNIPSFCPACEGTTQPNALECPHCGLFLA